ncbi:cardiolipin synthase, partial [Francisella tularensis subsp. holarctica]|nr:cardiolipin synthase [Francisella tularensis subsp. holarctica]
NLYIRSLFLNYEIAIFLYFKNDVAIIYRWAEKILADSTLNTQHMISSSVSLIDESILKIRTPLM